ncbi:porin family protein [Flavobacterium sp.]|uniref:porin family protein n=1 Tax=Flavobacterium sp. TaxID=239 RepID=UPI00391D1040
MRIKLLISVFFITLGSFAQDVDKDFDAPDSLYREDQFYLNITYNTLQKRPEGLKQNKLSPGLALGFLRDMPLNKKRTVSLAAGLGYSLAIYNQNMGIIDVGNVTTYSILDPDNITFSKNKLSLHYVDVPIEFRWRNSTPESHKFWRVHMGLKLSYLFYDQYKLESSQGNVGQTNLADLNDLHYGVYLTTGWNTWNLYAYFGLNPLFKSSAKIDGQSIDMNTANFGIMFYIL